VVVIIQFRIDVVAVLIHRSCGGGSHSVHSR
jgi:hypothetical protein